MAAGIHGSARTTPRVRAELQTAQATTRSLAVRYGLNPKTVAKWRSRSFTADARMGPARPRSTVLTEAEEAIVVEFRRRTLLPLDDVLGCLRETIPRLSRSMLYPPAGDRLAKSGVWRCKPRCAAYGRSSLAALVGTFLPRRLHPSVCR
jgi:transposase-like protein